MKIAVSCSGTDMNSPIDPRFGRAARFLVFDTDDGSSITVDNSRNMSAAQGAGIQAAQTVARSGAQVVITGHCGPKAFRALRAAEIQVVVNAQGTVAESIEQFTAGKLKPTDSADVEGHWA